jgi:hypothetical protein
MPRFLLAALVAALTLLASAPPALGAWTWPLRGELLTPYSNGTDPYAAGQHRGIDVAGRVGAPVVAATDGQVRFAGTVGASGLTVGVRTVDGRFDLSYLHLSAVAVRRGDAVSAGDRLGSVGVTGDRAVAAPHLHFGVRDAGSRHAYHDPLDFLGPPPAAPVHPPQPVPVPAPAPLAPRAAPAPALRSPAPQPLAHPRPALGPARAAAPAPAPLGHGHAAAPLASAAGRAAAPHGAAGGHLGHSERPAPGSARLGAAPDAGHARTPAPPRARAISPTGSPPDARGIGVGRLVAAGGLLAAALLLSGARRPGSGGRRPRVPSHPPWRRRTGLAGRA